MGKKVFAALMALMLLFSYALADMMEQPQARKYDGVTDFEKAISVAGNEGYDWYYEYGYWGVSTYEYSNSVSITLNNTYYPVIELNRCYTSDNSIYTYINIDYKVKKLKTSIIEYIVKLLDDGVIDSISVNYYRIGNDYSYNEVFSFSATKSKDFYTMWEVAKSYLN